MLNRWKKGLGMLFCLVMLLGFLVACGSDDVATPAEQPEGTDDPATETPEGERVVKIGALYDITGGTGDVGTPYAEGEQAYVEYINSKGGVDGIIIDLIGDDYAYNITEAQRQYQALRDRHNVSAILGWGTADTEALRQQVANDNLPFMSASYSENLKDLTESPLNFIAGATYSDQGRAIVDWIVENHDGENPTLALLYNDTAFGRSPIEDIKAYASENGVEVVDEQVIDLSATEAQSQMLNMERQDPDYAIINQTWGATATILREAQTLGIDTQFLGLNWATGEGVIDIAGDAAEGYMGVLTHAFPYEELEGMAEVEEYLHSKGKTLEDINQKFIQGWVTAKIMAEGIRNAADTELTGEDIKVGIESIENLDLGGLGAPVSFSADNHAGTSQIRLARVENGRWEPITDYFGVSD
ncbi:ABC transporter substrate-binding protein [Halalkalibacter nanhaiisediminis]|uniref:Branched-chain amino acid transport system substrate-binding protein n=1 Tax=Halalkalibacter nanhaiisediminis TaxID=688079 RepID=A0A562QQ86_9BACI|nr:ABC transporter substrate-binding protein [Halalkalibacter nanhaiisediminis]TWI58877.1 branched-chain amino acid transport system substrate-binding protein [Halalkalibacter nanhaiisediminis]